MNTLQDFRQNLIKLGFAAGRNDTYELFLSIDVFLRLSDRTGVVKMLAIINGVALHLPNIDITLPFDLYAYIENAIPHVKETYIETSQFAISNTVHTFEKWLATYKDGYTFYNFTRGCLTQGSVSYLFYFADDDIVCLHKICENEAITVNYQRKNIERIPSYKIVRFNHAYEILYEYAYDYAEVKTHYRKTAIDNILESL